VAKEEPKASADESTNPYDDVRKCLSADDDYTIIEALSPDIRALLSPLVSLPDAIVSLLAESETIFTGLCAAIVTVFRVSDTIALKVTSRNSAVTESRTLHYLERHLPDFPAPRPHGLIQLGRYYLLFTTFMGSHNLKEVWPQLDDAQKRGISTQLDSVMSRLRSLPRPENTLLGNVADALCTDLRRGTRSSKQPITSAREFDDFIFSGTKAYATPSFVQFLRNFKTDLPTQCVFTHGDLHPGNIIVEKAEDGSWQIAGIVEWEGSGFYPAYWEAVKMTNCLAAMDAGDWYLYLPESVAPQRYAVEWLVDRLLDWHLKNS
jgi:hypothetical protein